jgi:hypothetical protein
MNLLGTSYEQAARRDRFANWQHEHRLDEPSLLFWIFTP